ncbi:MAG: ATP-binding cassette domain-containing protein [Planctomycetota bacterium]|nr:MAG: ATP-binding cassette domain-containing protein [Planctomycetota bacterium]
MAGVILENVSRAYPGGVLAVDGVDLEVFDREFLVLVGPSGCGKTTTLRLIAGLEGLDGGTITIGSRRVNDVAAKDRDIAMVFQSYALYPHMTVYRNLAFGLELREGVDRWGRLVGWILPRRNARLKARRAAIADRVAEAARVLGIEDLLERYPRQLSGGQRQRVALGRAIVRQPAVFLFDEPLSNLDAKLRVEMRRELKQLHQRLATTMVYVTHDQIEALTLGERIVVMNEGKIQQVGPPMSVYNWPANRFVAGFIGTPAMNFVDGEIVQTTGLHFRRDNWSVPVTRPLKVDISKRNAVLGVRPEDVRPVPAGNEAQPQAVVELVEMLGDATVATLRLDDTNCERKNTYASHTGAATRVISKTEPRGDLRPGMRVGADLRSDRVHVFDPVTGDNWVRPDVALA